MYDVIVVGARPAGCMASKALAEKGYKVLLVEKFKMTNQYFPRTILMIFSFISNFEIRGYML